MIRNAIHRLLAG